MNKIEIFWGVDEEFESAIAGLNGTYFLRDILDLFNKTEIKIDGINTSPGEPLEVENLIVHTDDYGSMREWAILGFTNNILENLKVTVNNVWLSNPPKKYMRIFAVTTMTILLQSIKRITHQLHLRI